MKIGIVTYDRYHAKTSELAAYYQSVGHDILLLALPFKFRPSRSPLIIHRPDPFGPAQGDNTLSAFRTIAPELVEQENPRIDYFVIGAAGLISEDLIEEYPVLNVHSGYLPRTRGLDAFKWALLNGDPLGVTVHRINKEADAGGLVAQRLTPIYPWDSLETLAYRHYRNEIQLLKEVGGVFDPHKALEELPTDLAVNRRMPRELEDELVSKFPHIKSERTTSVRLDLKSTLASWV